MDTPKDLVIDEGFARFRPEGHVKLEAAVAMIGHAIAFCRKEGIQNLLVDTTKLTGFPPPTIIERYWFVREWAAEAAGAIRLAMVARPDFIDPQKFGVTVAMNAGLISDIFDSEPDAIAWLLAGRTD